VSENDPNEDGPKASDPNAGAPPRGPHPKTARALLVMAAVLLVPYGVPKLRALRVVDLPWMAPPATEAAEAASAATLESLQRASEAPAPTTGEQALPASDNQATINNALPGSRAPNPLPDLDPRVRSLLRDMPVEDPGGHALDAFFARLAKTDRKEPGAVTRILHYGDSTIASDYISGTVRRRLQARFGDAGHGFILVANPWEWYFHNDVTHASDGEWTASRLAGPIALDGMYGLGGVSFTSYGGGIAWFGTASRGDYGRSVSRFDLYYLEQPGGGTVEVTMRGRPPERFSTRGESKVSRVHAVHVDDGENKIGVRSAGGGPVRLFGVALERDTPGVVYDALGSHAAMAVYWQRQDRAHWKDQMALRDPALIVFQYGTNESDLWRLDRDIYEKALARLLDELHEVAPNASILVVSPLDRAEVQNGKLATKPVILDLVAIQRRVALSHGAAFWSTFDAMGGDGAMAQWVKAKPQLAGLDLTHPTPLGAEVLGDMLSDAVLRAYDARHP
jgi:lysophospholipase L1-like esterase